MPVPIYVNAGGVPHGSVVPTWDIVRRIFRPGYRVVRIDTGHSAGFLKGIGILGLNPSLFASLSLCLFDREEAIIPDHLCRRVSVEYLPCGAYIYGLISKNSLSFFVFGRF